MLPFTFKFSKSNRWLEFFSFTSKSKHTHMTEHTHLSKSTSLLREVLEQTVLPGKYLMWGNNDTKGKRLFANAFFFFFCWIWLLPEESCVYVTKTSSYFFFLFVMVYPGPEDHSLHTKYSCNDHWLGNPSLWCLAASGKLEIFNSKVGGNCVNRECVSCELRWRWGTRFGTHNNFSRNVWGSLREKINPM